MMMIDTYSERRRRCVALMRTIPCQALLLADPANLFYLTGDRRASSLAFITMHGEVGLLVPITDLDDVRRVAYYDCVVGYSEQKQLLDGLSGYFERYDVTRGMVGIERRYLSMAMADLITNAKIRPPRVHFVDAAPVLDELRSVKDAGEIACLGQAARVAQVGLLAALSVARPGKPESQVAAEAEYAMREAGAEAFGPTIILSGPRTRMAQGLPSDRVLAHGDLVTIDLHPIVHGYSVDLCRTVCLGRPTDEQERAYEVYLQAQQTTVKLARPGAPLDGLEQIMARVLEGAGLGFRSFGQPVHGVGIEAEEPPLSAQHSFLGRPDTPVLQEGMVISVGNCGLYGPSWGVRVEDTLVVGADAAQVLTGSPRSLRAAF